MSTLTEAEQKLNVGVIDFQNRAIKAQVWRCCLNCDYWAKPAGADHEMCDRYRQLPPPEVLVVGCPGWSSLIPF